MALVTHTIKKVKEKRKERNPRELLQKVRSLMDVVNSIPYGTEIPDPPEQDRWIGREHPGPRFKRPVESWISGLKGIPGLKNFDALLKFIFALRHDLDPVSEEEKWGAAYYWAPERIRALREFFDRLVELNQRHLKNARIFPDGDYHTWQDFQVARRVYVEGSDNLITLKDSPISELPLGAFEGRDVRRIRRCPVCKEVFWAERLDSFGCSSNHNATIRQWRSRLRSDKAELEKITEKLAEEMASHHPNKVQITRLEAKIDHLRKAISKYSIAETGEGGNK